MKKQPPTEVINALLNAPGSTHDIRQKCRVRVDALERICEKAATTEVIDALVNGLRSTNDVRHIECVSGSQ